MLPSAHRLFDCSESRMQKSAVEALGDSAIESGFSV